MLFRSLDLIEAIKSSASNAEVMAKEISDIRFAIRGSSQQIGLAVRHTPGNIEVELDKIVKGLASVEHAISMIDSR